MSAKENTIFGIYPVKEAIKSEVTFDKVYVQKDLDSDKINTIVSDLEKQNVTINVVPIEKLNRLTHGNHQGIVAITSPITFSTLESIVETVIAEKEYPKKKFTLPFQCNKV